MQQNMWTSLASHTTLFNMLPTCTFSSEGQIFETGPQCVKNGDEEDYSATDLWKGIYKYFSRRRRVCYNSGIGGPNGSMLRITATV